MNRLTITILTNKTGKFSTIVKWLGEIPRKSNGEYAVGWIKEESISDTDTDSAVTKHKIQKERKNPKKEKEKVKEKEKERKKEEKPQRLLPADFTAQNSDELRRFVLADSNQLSFFTEDTRSSTGSDQDGSSESYGQEKSGFESQGGSRCASARSSIYPLKTPSDEETESDDSDYSSSELDSDSKLQ